MLEKDNFRSMSLEVGGELIYESTFDSKTGTIVRRHLDIDIYPYRNSRDTPLGREFSNHWEARFASGRRFCERHKAFSPVPETIDIAINDYCPFGCKFCYTDATVKGRHMNLDLLQSIISGFDKPPYQIAFGGGSPTHHPDFIEALRLTRELGVVPNYTTEGLNLTDKILDATNKYCGGVALSCHLWKGPEHFIQAYRTLKEAIPNKQLNVHVIANKYVVEALDFLNSLNFGPMNIVVLAFYPNVGRSNLQDIMDKKTMNLYLPNAIQESIKNGHKIAFSEGLIPYFLSRPEIGVDTRMVTPVESYFSCFFDINGRISDSSFSPPSERKGISYKDMQDSAANTRSQLLWEQLYDRRYSSRGARCETCHLAKSCSVPDDTHYFNCKYSEVNDVDGKLQLEDPRKVLVKTSLDKVLAQEMAEIENAIKALSEDDWLADLNIRNEVEQKYNDSVKKAILENRLRLTVTSGFVTNSSSVIHHFDARVLEDPEVKRLFEAYEITGFVGKDLWDREYCMTIAITNEQKQDLARKIVEDLSDKDIYSDRNEYINPNHTGPIVVYGDEYSHLAHYVASLLSRVSKDLGISKNPYGLEYN